MCEAARKRQIQLMRVLLQQGAPVDVGTYAESPLHIAAKEGEKIGEFFGIVEPSPQEDVIRLLLQHGADVNASGRDGTTPLMYAVKYGDWEAICLLLRKGANVDARDDMYDDSESDDSQRGQDVEAYAWRRSDVVALLAAVRAEGDGDLGVKRYYERGPLTRVLSLRILCERGRASNEDALLKWLFPYVSPLTAHEHGERALTAALAEQGAEGINLYDPIAATKAKCLSVGVKFGFKAKRLPEKYSHLPLEVFKHIFEYWRFSPPRLGPDGPPVYPEFSGDAY